MTTEEGNKIIAEFMGLLWDKDCKKYGKSGAKDGGFDWYEPAYMGYHRLWDWIMPVAFKIKCYAVPEQGDEETQYDLERNAIRLWANITYAVSCINIEMLWQQVVEFIKWYNQNNK